MFFHQRYKVLPTLLSLALAASGFPSFAASPVSGIPGDISRPSTPVPLSAPAQGFSSFLTIRLDNNPQTPQVPSTDVSHSPQTTPLAITRFPPLISAAARPVTHALDPLRPIQALADRSREFLKRGDTQGARRILNAIWGYRTDRSQVAGEPVQAFHSSPTLTEKELEQIFTQENPDSHAVSILESYGLPFPRLAFELIETITYYINREDSIEINTPPFVLERKKFFKVLKDILDFAAKADHNERARIFVTGLARMGARWHYDEFQESPSIRFPQAPKLPLNPNSKKEYWDMASGMNAGISMMRGLDPQTKYRFLDNSLFVVEYLKEIVRILSRSNPGISRNVQIMHQDIRQLEMPPPDQPLGTIRAKNVTVYVKGFERDLEKMTKHLEPGGQVILQNDPKFGQRKVVREDWGPVISRLIRQGWDFQFSLADPFPHPGPVTLDTLTLTKPSKGSPKKSRFTWEDYLKAVNKN
ncbi:MAG: hypothetical protein HY399_06615 [Elusimicrobia bacterium]|nr:hypothetical protein [Elusimicrobiota bacterium]